MRPLTYEWVQKAEGDFATTQRELRARKSPNYDSACFHAQQCAEKYLKARLQETDIRFSRTHNLLVLLELVLPVEPSWEQLRSSLNALNAFAIEVRYPGGSASRTTAREAVHLCQAVRRMARQGLGLES